MAAALMMLTGCIGTLFSYKGAVVAQKKNRFAFQEGEQQAEWKTNELGLTYQYQKTDGTLKISGTIKPLGGLEFGFTIARSVVFNILFLDKQGTVINTSILFSTGDNYAITDVPISFVRTIPVPDGTDTYSFAYSGALANSGVNASTTCNIDYFPQ